tara:strand:+ start:448 stop:579 length:132 start_codon:yes stop_codon:yes gene_type:complete
MKSIAHPIENSSKIKEGKPSLIRGQFLTRREQAVNQRVRRWAI